MKAIIGLVICALCAAEASAQTEAAMPINAQALTYVRDGAVQGCGVRLTGGESGAPVSAWFDVSFNLFRRGYGVAQSIAYEVRQSEDGTSRPARVPVQTTWIKATDGSARLGENIERRESLVYALVVEDVLALFEALAESQPLVLGIKRWGQRVDSIYTGTPILTADSRHRISVCLGGLAFE